MHSVAESRIPAARHGARCSTATGWLLLVVCAALPLAALSAGASKPVPGSPHGDHASSWQSLSASQRTALKPLERDWGHLSDERRQKWLEIAGRFSKLPPAEQARIQTRMASWVDMTPQQRGQARLNYQEAKQAGPQDLRAEWDAYQSLPPERKRQLAARAAPAAARAPSGKANPATRNDSGDRLGSVQTKSNIVLAPVYAAGRKAVAPTVVQAQSGATTTLISRRPTPPSHQQAGLPKIAATPLFVDAETLLPQRGAQGAAAHSFGNASESPDKHD